MKVFSNGSVEAFLYQKKCYLIDLSNGTLLNTLVCDSEILCGLFSPYNDYVALATYKKELSIYSVESGSLLATVRLEKKCSTMCATVHENVSYIVLGDKIGDILAYDIPLLRKRRFLVGHCATVITDICISHNLLISSDRDEKMFICNFPQTYNIQSICVGHKLFINSVSCSYPNVVTGGGDNEVILWNCDSGKEIYRWDLRSSLMPSEEDASMIVNQLIFVNPTTVLCILEESPIVLVLTLYEKSIKRMNLKNSAISAWKKDDLVRILTDDLDSYAFLPDCTLHIAKESECVKKTLIALKYVYEKPTDDEQSGEYYKRSSKQKMVISHGMEKQFEHKGKQLILDKIGKWMCLFGDSAKIAFLFKI